MGEPGDPGKDCFEPEIMEAMRAAYRMARVAPKFENAAEVMTEVLAEKIVELAEEGETDPARLSMARYVECCIERPLAVHFDAARARAVGRKTGAPQKIGKLEFRNERTSALVGYLARWSGRVAQAQLTFASGPQPKSPGWGLPPGHSAAF